MAVVLVSGALANKLHNGGAAWTRLSWALGLKALGFEVAFVEQIRADCCVDASGRPCTFEESANREYFREVTAQFGLSEPGDADLRQRPDPRPHPLRAG